MIELEIQFQLVISCILIGMVCANLYSLIDILMGKSKVLRSIIELCFFTIITISFYYFIYLVNSGVLNFYIPICLIIGIYLHKRFYDKHFSCVYNYWFLKIHSIIRINKERCKRVWKGLMSKIIKKPKSTE
jgi:hypothetical protein